jgi:hypothetical protein
MRSSSALLSSHHFAKCVIVPLKIIFTEKGTTTMAFSMSIREVYEKRALFQRAPDSVIDAKDLTLRAKQAIVDKGMRGESLGTIDLYEVHNPDGSVTYMVKKGYATIRAIIDFMDSKFPTWSEEEMREYYRQHK